MKIVFVLTVMVNDHLNCVISNRFLNQETQKQIFNIRSVFCCSFLGDG
ncbi:hypothetical protein DESC_190056 [Desulfosarcina cetonica]|nr:hypothetical protein DESC_190056 [Desulfosarcina cetonica]